MERSLDDPVIGDKIKLSDLEMMVLVHPRVERLRHIRQNGFSYLKFPGAVHNRFDHSLGVMYWATLMYRSLFGSDTKDLSTLRIAALIHDIGHGPFSHASELLIQRNPEWAPVVRTYKVEDGEIRREGSRRMVRHEDLTLEFVAEELPEIIDDLTPRVFEILSGGAGTLSKLLASDLDADRIDYLVRDAYHSEIPFGSELGNVFRRVVCDHLAVTEKAGRDWITVGSEGIRGVEIFLTARFAAYRTIYHDPLSRSAESVLVSAIERVMDDMQQGERENLLRHLFTTATDQHFISGIGPDPISTLVEDPMIRKAMDEIRRMKCWYEKRFITLTRTMVYNLIKVQETGELRSLEESLSLILNRDVHLNLSIPNTLATDLCVSDNDIHPRYNPAFLYDYSPLVRALEDAMYSTATIVSNHRLDRLIGTRVLAGPLNSIASRHRDTPRDLIAYSVVSFLSRLQKAQSQGFELKALHRRSRTLFEMSKVVSDRIDGIDFDFIPPESPFYCKEVYSISRLLVFLRALIEVQDDATKDGHYVPSYFCVLGPGAPDVRRAVSLSEMVISRIEEVLQDFINTRVGRCHPHEDIPFQADA